MRTVVVAAEQTLADIAIQEFGSLEAVYDIAEMNDIPIAARLQDGALLKLPDKQYNTKMREFCALNMVKPATEVGDELCRVFSVEFSKEFI